MNELANTEVKQEMTQIEDNDFIGMLQSRQLAYCSFTPTNEAEQDLLFNATNGDCERLKSQVNKKLLIKNVYVEVVELANEDGEIQKAPRIVLMDANGKGYACVSMGVYSSLQKIFTIYGEPKTWKKPLSIVPFTVDKKDRSILTLRVER